MQYLLNSVGSESGLFLNKFALLRVLEGYKSASTDTIANNFVFSFHDMKPHSKSQIYVPKSRIYVCFTSTSHHDVMKLDITQLTFKNILFQELGECKIFMGFISLMFDPKLTFSLILLWLQINPVILWLDRMGENELRTFFFFF